DPDHKCTRTRRGGRRNPPEAEGRDEIEEEQIAEAERPSKLGDAGHGRYRPAAISWRYPCAKAIARGSVISRAAIISASAAASAVRVECTPSQYTSSTPSTSPNGNASVPKVIFSGYVSSQRRSMSLNS